MSSPTLYSRRQRPVRLAMYVLAAVLSSSVNGQQAPRRSSPNHLQTSIFGAGVNDGRQFLNPRFQGNGLSWLDVSTVRMRAMTLDLRNKQLRAELGRLNPQSEIPYFSAKAMEVLASDAVMNRDIATAALNILAIESAILSEEVNKYKKTTQASVDAATESRGSSNGK